MRIVTWRRLRWEVVGDEGHCRGGFDKDQSCPFYPHSLPAYQVDKQNRRIWPHAGRACINAAEITKTEEVPDGLHADDETDDR